MELLLCELSGLVCISFNYFQKATNSLISVLVQGIVANIKA